MRRWISFAILLLVASASANAQTEVVIDLSDPANLSTVVPEGRLSIKVINMIPGKEYSVTTKVEPIIESPVSIAAAKVPPATPPAPVAPAPGGAVPPAPPLAPADPICDPLQARVDAATTGDALAEVIASLRQPTTCSTIDAIITGACAKLLKMAEDTVKKATTGKLLATAIVAIRNQGSVSGCTNVADYAEKICDDHLTTAKAAIKKATTETEMAAATATIRAIRDVCPTIGPYLDSIELELGPITLGRSEMLTVTIVRKDNNATWTRQYSTGKRGEWLTGYGIMIVPNRDANYSTFTIDTNRFQIRRSRDREAFDYIPTLTFTFMRPQNAPKDWFLSPVFGIGYDLSAITGNFGYAYTYNHNFAVSAGVMIHQQRRLKGKFEEDGHIGTNLDNNDLTEMTWAPNVYVGITIRSLTNPFAR